MELSYLQRDILEFSSKHACHVTYEDYVRARMSSAGPDHAVMWMQQVMNSLHILAVRKLITLSHPVCKSEISITPEGYLALNTTDRE